MWKLQLGNQGSGTLRETNIRRVCCFTNKLDIKINLKSILQKKEKSKKGTKHQGTERHNIKGVVTKVKTKYAMLKLLRLSMKEKELK